MNEDRSPQGAHRELTPDSREDFERVGAEAGGREMESDLPKRGSFHVGRSVVFSQFFFSLGLSF